MNLWKLEWLRMIRTFRFLIIPGLFVVSGILGPVLARFLPDLIREVGNGVEITLPDPTPYEGIVQYLGNVEQLGLLGVAIFAAMTVAFDAKREIAVFLRSRASIPAILTPRLVSIYALTVVSVALGTVVAIAMTELLLGTPPVSDVVVGAALYALYLGYVIGVTTAISSFIRSVLVTAILSVVAIIISGLLTLIPSIGAWLPSELSGATIALMDGGDFVYVGSILVTAAVSAGLIWLSIYRLDQREI